MNNTQDISKIVEVLERDEALDFDTERQTYSDGFNPVPVNWDRLFPTSRERAYREWRSENDWDVHDIGSEREDSAEDWAEELPKDLVEEIVSIARDGKDLDEYPEDISRETGIWDRCAWYQPIHFFAHDWGIFVREDCLLSQAKNIASKLRLGGQRVTNPSLLTKALLRASFSTFFLHEQFHHKVECLGLRLHVVLGFSAYLPYESSVYRATFGSDDCLEEALANADSYRRLGTSPYKHLLGDTVLTSTREYLENRFVRDPPGYRMAGKYLKRRGFEDGLNELQGQVREATLKPVRPAANWSIAKRLTQSYFSKNSDIYTVVRRGSRSVLPTGTLSLCSSKDMVKIFRHKGWREVPGGKGSHVKLEKPGKRPMILPGNRKDLSMGVISSALKALGNYTIADLGSLKSGV